MWYEGDQEREIWVLANTAKTMWMESKHNMSALLWTKLSQLNTFRRQSISMVIAARCAVCCCAVSQDRWRSSCLTTQYSRCLHIRAKPQLQRLSSDHVDAEFIHPVAKIWNTEFVGTYIAPQSCTQQQKNAFVIGKCRSDADDPSRTISKTEDDNKYHFWTR